jgi:GGDEF domain-containing protein
MLFKRKPREGDAEGGPNASGPPPGGPEAALRDELGLHHLWYLELRLREELARASRANGMFSLAAWKLRLLPGEAPSDDYLRQAAAFITSQLRTYDLVARIDAERFVAILLDAGHEDANNVAFRIKGDLQIKLPSAGRWQAGVATFSRDGVDGDSLIQATFRRLEGDARAA